MEATENLKIYERSREVPEAAKKEIRAGRTKGFTDINPMWRIKKLTELFGPCGIGWYYTVDRQWTEAAGSEVMAFVNISLYIKVGDEWSKPIQGTGGSRQVTQEKSGLYASDECYKMATTDAISVACKQLGIGADVYFANDPTKYTAAPEPVLVDAVALEKIRQEMERTGTTERTLLHVYQIKKLADMTLEQFENCMARFENTPTKITQEQEEALDAEVPFR